MSLNAANLAAMMGNPDAFGMAGTAAAPGAGGAAGGAGVGGEGAGERDGDQRVRAAAPENHGEVTVFGDEQEKCIAQTHVGRGHDLWL